MTEIAVRDLRNLTTQTVGADYSSNRCSGPIYADWQQTVLQGGMSQVVRHASRFTNKLDSIDGFLTDDLVVTRRYNSGIKGTHEIALAVGEKLNVLFERSPYNLEVSVSSQDPDYALAYIKSVFDQIPEAKPKEGVVDAWVWYLGSNGPSRSLKKLVVPAWKEIEENYEPEVRPHIDQMMGLHRPVSSGKIVLWHGPPGTGKTTALRALAREWNSWCEFHYISDPEKFFAEPSYLMEVGTTSEEADNELEFEEDDDSDDRETKTAQEARRPKWRLVVCEDSGDFLRSNAKATTDAPLGRLLNFSDGILGQGSNTLILLTTNEKLSELHQAVTRPGRCLAQMEFKAFTPAQARKWFSTKETKVSPSGDMTLASMIDSLHGDNSQINNGIYTETHGQYL